VHVSSLHVYPVKSTAGLAVPQARVHPWGLDGDRRWMVVDERGTTVTARVQRKLLHVRATPSNDEGIRLSAPGMPDLEVEEPGAGPPVALTMSRLDTAVSAGDAAHEWLSTALGSPVHLVWLEDPRRRAVGISHGGRPEDLLNLSDAGPVLLTSTASLTTLNRWIDQTAADRAEPRPDPLPMERFRPNIVVDGAPEAFLEDDWKLVRAGDVEMRFGEHCDRCVLPTIDPRTLASSKEPTRTLALHRQWDHEVFFGVRLIPMTTGTISVGDDVAAS
jgi:MOSC domain-containing protein